MDAARRVSVRQHYANMKPSDFVAKRDCMLTMAEKLEGISKKLQRRGDTANQKMEWVLAQQRLNAKREALEKDAIRTSEEAAAQLPPEQASEVLQSAADLVRKSRLCHQDQARLKNEVMQLGGKVKLAKSTTKREVMRPQAGTAHDITILKDQLHQLIEGYQRELQTCEQDLACSWPSCVALKDVLMAPPHPTNAPHCIDRNHNVTTLHEVVLEPLPDPDAPRGPPVGPLPPVVEYSQVSTESASMQGHEKEALLRQVPTKAGDIHPHCECEQDNTTPARPQTTSSGGQTAGVASRRGDAGTSPQPFHDNVLMGRCSETGASAGAGAAEDWTVCSSSNAQLFDADAATECVHREECHSWQASMGPGVAGASHGTQSACVEGFHACGHADESHGSTHADVVQDDVQCDVSQAAGQTDVSQNAAHTDACHGAGHAGVSHGAAHDDISQGLNGTDSGRTRDHQGCGLAAPEVSADGVRATSGQNGECSLLDLILSDFPLAADDVGPRLQREYHALCGDNKDRLQALKAEYGVAVASLRDSGGAQWLPEEHAMFLHHYNHLKFNPSLTHQQMVLRLASMLPGRSKEDVAGHLSWHTSVNLLQRKVSDFQAAWQRRDQQFLQDSRQLLQALQQKKLSSLQQEADHVAWEVARELQHQGLQEIRQERLEEWSCNLERMKGLQQRELEQSSVQALLQAAEQDETKAQLARHRYTLESQQLQVALASVDDRLEGKLRELEDAEFNNERVRYRQAEQELKRAMREEQHQLKLDEEFLQERRLEQLRKKVQPQVECNPDRMTGPTLSSAALPVPQGAVFRAVNGYTTAQVLKDQRFRLAEALNAAGLRGTEYGRQALMKARAATQTRVDNLTSDQRSSGNL